MKKLLLIFIFLPVVLFADEQLPESGLLATSSNLTGENERIEELPWGGLSLDSEGEDNPLSGSIQRLSSTEYSYTIKNNTEDYYAANIKIVEFNKQNRKIKTNTVPVRLKAGEAVTRSQKVRPQTVNIELELSKWKRKEKKKTPEEIKEAIEEKREELRKLEQELAAISEEQ